MLTNLFNPIQIGNMTSKNRLLMSAMSINLGVDDDGCVTDQLVEHFMEKAKGGIGMMLVGGGSVHPGGRELPDLPQRYNDKGDRDQIFLLPPSIDDWVSKDPPVRFVQTCLDQMNLYAFYKSYAKEVRLMIPV